MRVFFDWGLGMSQRLTFDKDTNAPFSALRRQLGLLYASLKYSGLKDTISRISQFEADRFGLSRSAQATGIYDVVEVDRLDIPEDKRSLTMRYEATPDLEFRYVLESLDLRYSEYDFVDFGSGKGAVLALAGSYPFNRVTGVEHCAKLHAMAERVIAKLEAAARIPQGTVTSLHGDAAELELPAAPYVYYLFNPFGAQTLRDVLKACVKASKETSRPSYILSKNPVHSAVYDEMLGIRLIAQPLGGSWKIYEITPPP